MGMVKLMDDSDNGDTGANHYNFTIAASPDEITPQIVQGNVDIAAVPANLASVLYNKEGVDVSVLAVNTLGVLYIVENGDSVQSVADLKGKTIYASGKGATPEYALNYMLTANGIDPEKMSQSNTNPSILNVWQHSQQMRMQWQCFHSHL